MGNIGLPLKRVRIVEPIEAPEFSPPVKQPVRQPVKQPAIAEPVKVRR